MPKIVVGYGKYTGYRISEIPSELLNELARWYPLEIPGENRPDYDDLIVTIAIHCELRRREADGGPEPHVPTLRELAEEIIRHGYRQSSKEYHPDRKGHHEAEVSLTAARNELLRASSNFVDDVRHDDTITIGEDIAPPNSKQRRPGDPVTDDDVPF